MKRCKKLLAAVLCCVVVCGGVSGCRKSDPEPEAATVVGTYRLNRTPLYCELEAAEPKAVALVIDGVEMTYASINAMVMLSLGQVVCDEDIRFSFNADGTVGVAYCDEVVVPDLSEGIVPAALTYRVADGRIYLSVGEQIVRFVLRKLDAGTPELEAAEIGAVEVTLNYSLEGGQLSLYADKALAAETLDKVSALFGHAAGAAGAEIVAALLPQLPNVLDGYNKFNFGVAMSRLY